MGKTSSAVKRKYNAKTYKRWTADIKNEQFDKIEQVRDNMKMSRSEFLQFLLNNYINNNKSKETIN